MNFFNATVDSKLQSHRGWSRVNKHRLSWLVEMHPLSCPVIVVTAVADGRYQCRRTLLKLWYWDSSRGVAPWIVVAEIDFSRLPVLLHPLHLHLVFRAVLLISPVMLQSNGMLTNVLRARNNLFSLQKAYASIYSERPHPSQLVFPPLNNCGKYHLLVELYQQWE